MSFDNKMKEKIRRRQSYKMFKEILECFRNSEVEGLLQVFYQLDKKQAFHSATHARYASESLHVLLKDEKY